VRSLTVVAVVAFTAIASAQGGGKPTTGNPTPGTTQPDPPNPANRVTFTGCLQSVSRAAATTAEANAPSNARFELTRAERLDRVPAGTGGSPATASVSSKTFRLEGIDSQFSPFVGAKVEASGEINVKGPGAPTLIVEFIQKLAAKC
jgi:hypothetical protein